MQNARLWEKEQEQPKINQHYGGNANPEKTLAFVAMGIMGIMGVMGAMGVMVAMGAMGAIAAHEIEFQGLAQGCSKQELTHVSSRTDARHRQPVMALR